MKQLLFLCAMLLIFNNSAEACLGKSPEKCERLYGKLDSSESDDEVLYNDYIAMGRVVRVAFCKGKAVASNYQALIESAIITRKFFNQILKWNSEGKEWKFVDGDRDGGEWIREDQKARAIYTKPQKKFFGGFSSLGSASISYKSSWLKCGIDWGKFSVAY